MHHIAQKKKKKKEKSQSQPQLPAAVKRRSQVSSLGTASVKSSQLLLHRMVSHA